MLKCFHGITKKCNSVHFYFKLILFCVEFSGAGIPLEWICLSLFEKIQITFKGKCEHLSFIP